jgi:hypothetical protein
MLALCLASPAAAEASLPGDNASLVGDRMTFRATARGFKLVAPVDTATGGTDHCARAGSVALVTSATKSQLFMRFADLGEKSEAATQSCPDAVQVRLGEQYKVEREPLLRIDHARTGLSFGGLVIPFKYRMGDDKELVASPAIAPFVGYRMSFTQRWGFTFKPVAASGLSLVPVPTADGKETENKAAYTVALGFRITSSKNEQFSAGLLYGRDFLSSRDTATNPKLKKPWLSIYLGASV